MCGKSIWLRALPVVETRQVWANQYTVFPSHGMATGTYFKECGSEDCVWMCMYVYTSVTDRQGNVTLHISCLSTFIADGSWAGWRLWDVFFTCVHFKKNCTVPSTQRTLPDPQTSALRDLYICHFGLICLMRYPRAELCCIASLHIFIYTKRGLLVDLSEELSEGFFGKNKK